MAETHPGPVATELTADAHQLLRVLERIGPLELHDLVTEPALSGWSAERLEDAVVSAWARALISVDRHDRLVAL